MLCADCGGHSDSWPWRSSRSMMGSSQGAPEGPTTRRWPCLSDRASCNLNITTILTTLRCLPAPIRHRLPHASASCWSFHYCSRKLGTTLRSVASPLRSCSRVCVTASRSAWARSLQTALMVWRGCFAPGWRRRVSRRVRHRQDHCSPNSRGRTQQLL